jgi:hypothetical protein
LGDILALEHSHDPCGSASCASHTGKSADDIIKEQGLGQMSDTREIEEAIAQVISANPQPVADFKAGKVQALKFLVGQVMKKTRGRADPKELTRILQKEQIQVMNVAPKRARLSIPFLKREKVRLKELAVYSRQLSVLIDAELPLIQSLNILSEITESSDMKNVIKSVLKSIREGKVNLSDAYAKPENPFEGPATP